MRTCVPRAGAGTFLLFLCFGACDRSARTPPRAIVLEICSPSGSGGLAQLLREAGFEIESVDCEVELGLNEIALLAFGSFVSEAEGYPGFLERNREAMLEFVRGGGVLLQMSQLASIEAQFPLLGEEHRSERQPSSCAQSFVRDEGHPLLRNLLRSSHGRMDSIELPALDEQEPSRFPITSAATSRQLLMADRRGESTALAEGQLGAGRILLTSFWFDRSVDGEGKSRGDPLLSSAARTFFLNLRAYVTALRQSKLPPVRALDPFPIPEPAAFVAGSWTLVVLPDTQGYTRNRPELFAAQTEWIAANVRPLDIRFVMHVGDVTYDNTHPQWEAARAAMAKLHNAVGYAVTTGNHDLGPRGYAGSRRTLFHDYFPLSELQTYANLLEHLDGGANFVHQFHSGSEPWIVLTLEWGPRAATLQWADQMLKKYKRRRAIVVTHAYLHDGDLRQNHRLHPSDASNPHSYATASMKGGTNDGEEIWQKLISKHPNVDFVFSGHQLGDGLGRLSSTHGNGHVVHQLLANYQEYEFDGGAYLRLVEFLPDGKTVQIKTYSPYLDRYYTDWENQFVLELSPRSRKPS